MPLLQMAFHLKDSGCNHQIINGMDPGFCNYPLLALDVLIMRSLLSLLCVFSVTLFFCCFVTISWDTFQVKSDCNDAPTYSWITLQFILPVTAYNNLAYEKYLVKTQHSSWNIQLYPLYIQAPDVRVQYSAQVTFLQYWSTFALALPDMN